MPPLIWLLPNFIARVIPIESGARGKASRQFHCVVSFRVPRLSIGLCICELRAYGALGDSGCMERNCLIH